jgi:ubiquinone/menaquinone biosynthesis C-methylase UbiE
MTVTRQRKKYIHNSAEQSTGLRDYMMTKGPREHWDKQASVYSSDESFRRFGRFLDLYEENCWRYIEPVLPKAEGSLILEAGCGTGRWVLRLAPMGYQMVLSDLSPEMVRHARTRVERLGLSGCVSEYHVLDICDMHTLPDATFDLVLALGGPLTLCRNSMLAVNEFRRVTKPGGHVICDAANRYRTALDLVLEKEVSQLEKVLDTGQFSRPDGLTDHRFGPQELANLFEENGMHVLHVAGVCPFFDFLPRKEHIGILDDEKALKTMLDVCSRYAEDPVVVGLSGRLLVVTQRSD